MIFIPPEPGYTPDWGAIALIGLFLVVLTCWFIWKSKR